MNIRTLLAAPRERQVVDVMANVLVALVTIVASIRGGMNELVVLVVALLVKTLAAILALPAQAVPRLLIGAWGANDVS